MSSASSSPNLNNGASTEKASSASSKHPLGNLHVGSVGTWQRVMKPEYTAMYAEITGDYNPLHFQSDYAKSTRMQGLVCHGGLASGMLNALVAEEIPGPGSVFMKQELEYTAPTRPGDTLIATGTVTWIHETKPVCHLDVSVKIKESNVEVLKGKVVVYRMLPQGEKSVTTKSSTKDNE